MGATSSRSSKNALLSSVIVLAAVSACALFGGSSDDGVLHLTFTVEFKGTASLCGPGIQYCVTRTPATGSFPGELTVQGSGTTLVVGDACSRSGTVQGDSVHIWFTATKAGPCYTFSMHARIDGRALSGNWNEYTDGHGGGTGGSVKSR